MPIYTYWCTDCKEATERSLKINDRENQYCDCGNHLTREFKFHGVVFSETTNGGMK